MAPGFGTVELPKDPLPHTCLLAGPLTLNFPLTLLAFPEEVPQADELVWSFIIH